MKKFYLHDGKAQHGPYDIDELKQQNISPQTPVWFNTLKDWTPAGQVEELKGLFTSAPPPPFKKKQPNRKPWIIGLSIASVIFLVIILLANNWNKKSNQPATKDTTSISDPKKTRLQELEEKERQRQALENAQEIINREYRNNWRQYIKHKTSDFKVGFFGGITDLEITVTNNTESIIDEMVVKVDYIKESGELWETKEVVFNNVQPGTSKSANAPETNRGVKIETAITRITARSLSFCYDITKEKQRKRNNPADPYKCM
jgi:hypothetical protein